MAAVTAINGTPLAAGVVISLAVTLYGRGETPSYRFFQRGGPLSGFGGLNNVAVTLTQDGALIFAGDTVSSVTRYDPHFGWVREWEAQGLINRANRVPVTDSITLTDTIQYNLKREDGADYLPSRAGRSVAQIVSDVLCMPANLAGLAARGIGGYVTTGSDATGTAAIGSGAVTGVSVTAGGSGYGALPPTVFFSGGGGTGATATAVLTGGAVTSVTITNGGTGYTTPPSVVFSALPTATLADLDAMSIIPPQRVSVAGERILQALEGAVQVYYPNHWLHVEPTGIIRFLDPRTFPADVTLTLDGSDHRVTMPTLSRDWNSCYQRVVIRGDTQIRGLTFSVQPRSGSTLPDGGATEDFAHDGLTNAEAKDAFTAADWNQPGQSSGQARGTASVGSGAVTGITVANNGYGYTGAPSVLISGGGGSGATATASLTADKVTSFAITNGGSGYVTTPTVTVTAPGVGQSVVGTCTMPDTTTVTITPTDPTIQFPANHWDQTESGHQGYLVLSSDTIADITQHFPARILANTALSPGGTCDLTIDAPAPALTYDTFELFGLGGGAGNVYRKYKIAEPFGSKIQQMFPYEVSYRRGSEMAATLVTTPQASVFYSPSGEPPYQVQSVMVASIDPDAGTVTLAKPTALVFSPDGIELVEVNDVQFFLPIAVGSLEAVYPPDVAGVPQYSGTSHADEGLTETKYVTVREWRDFGNATNMLRWASEIHGAMCDTVTEGDVEYLGLLTDVLTPGHAVNLPGNGYTTGWEAVDLPIARCSLEYHSERSATSYTMNIHLSNRRSPYSGEAFLRPAQTGLSVSGPAGMAGGFDGSANAEAYQNAAEAHQNGSFGGLGTGNATTTPYGDTSNLPTTLADLGLPTSVKDLGLPTTLQDLGLPTRPGDVL